MTIALSLIFTRRRWTFPNIPGMPAGAWVAAEGSEGDASGGDITFQHIFENVSNQLGDSNFYSLEHIMVNNTSSSGGAAGIRIRGMDPGAGQISPILQPITTDMAFPLQSNGSAASSQFSIEPKNQNPRRWIGTFHGLDTEFGDVIVITQNPTATDIVTVKLEGYWWTPDAINAPGGLRRPPGALYG